MRKIIFLYHLLFSIGIYCHAQVKVVDLGLPSGTLWADRNVGAKGVGDFGYYFAWGETQQKNEYGDKNYKFRKVSDVKKYNNSNLETLSLENDAAYQNMGEAWRMPSKEQLEELRTHCTWILAGYRSRPIGYVITGPNGNAILLPCAGYPEGANPEHYAYWSRDFALSESNNTRAWCLTNFYPRDTTTCIESHGGSLGHAIRAVYAGGNNPPNNNELAKLTFKSASVSTTPNYTVEVGIKSSSVITESKVYVNGVLYYCLDPEKKDGYEFIINQEVVFKEVVLRNGRNEIRVEVTNASGTSTETHYITCNGTGSVNRPELTWKSPLTATSKDYSLLVGVKSLVAVSDVQVYHNGQLSRGVAPVRNDGDDYSVKRIINLSDGENIIRVDVTNEGGTSTITKTISFRQKNSPEPNPAPTPNNDVVPVRMNRLALVIGNGRYTYATKLPNPTNDATDISQKLRSLGFDVIEKHDLTTREFKAAIREFGSKAPLYDACMLYYAGHAIERDGKNYLIPVDAALETQADIEDECVRADYIIDHLADAKSKMSIIVLDACRNNPVTRSWTRSITGGLSSMIAPSGTFIAFSTSPGKTADDGDGRNSPFTEAFLKNLDKPNLQLEMFFKEVLKDVRIKTSERQIPWSQSSFYGDFFFNKK